MMSKAPELLSETILRLPGYDPYRDADGFRFDTQCAQDHIDFFAECLVHVKAAKAGKPFILEPWQQAIVANLFGWKSEETGLRRYREVFIMVGRKNGKTPLAAGLLLDILFRDNEPGAEVYGAASEYKQASLVFEHARGMVRKQKELRARCKIYDGQAKSIQLKSDASTYRVIASGADASHGFNTHAAVIDELHKQPNRELVDALLTSTGARAQPLIIHITTSDYDREGSICNEKCDYAYKVRDGKLDPPDPSFLPVIYEADQDQGRDYTDPLVYGDPAIWLEANPNLGVSLSHEYLEREARRAHEVPTFLNTFLRLHLNIRTGQATRDVLTEWNICDGSVDEEKLIGRPCFGGLDLASRRDIAAWVLLFPPEEDDDDERWVILPRFFAPGDNAEARERQDKAPYQTWGRQGHLTLTEGSSIDYAAIRDRVLDDSRRFALVDVGADRWNLEFLRQQLDLEDIEVVEFGQGYRDMSEPTKELDKLVAGHQIAHGGHPVLKWMVSNAVIREDEAGNIKFDRKRSSDKIDGLVALVMALGRAMVYEGGSVYESRGALRLGVDE